MHVSYQTARIHVQDNVILQRHAEPSRVIRCMATDSTLRRRALSTFLLYQDDLPTIVFAHSKLGILYTATW